MRTVTDATTSLLDQFAFEIARSLADVGVKGNKLYLAAVVDNLPESLTSLVLPDVAGVSATRDIWKQFSPDAGRSLLFIMPADETLRANRLVRIGYDTPRKILANNAALLRRVMPINNVVAFVLKRAVRAAKLSGDDIAVSNMAESIMHAAKRDGNLDADRLPTAMDKNSFGPITSLGLDLSTIDRFANLYYQAAKGTGSYGKYIGKFFSPPNRTKWVPVLSAALVEQASIYADEAEWRNLQPTLQLPKTTHVLYAVEAKYVNNKPTGPLGWMRHEEESLARYHATCAKFEAAGLKYTVVDYRKTMDSMHAAQARKRLSHNG